MAKDRKHRDKLLTHRKTYLEALESRTLLSTSDISISLLPPPSSSAFDFVNFVATVSSSENSNVDGLNISLYRDGSPVLTSTIANNQATFRLKLAAGDHAYSARITLDNLRPNPGNLGFFPTTGNYYESVNGSMPWTDASTAAQSRTYAGRRGRLATVSSSAEDNFIYSLMGSSSGDHWLGGLQPPGSTEPSGGWQWVTGEPFSYSNWRYDEPNNHFGNAPNEDRISKFVGNNGAWLDIPNTLSSYSGGYIVEYSGDLVFTGGISNSTSVTGLTSPTTATASASELTIPYGGTAPITISVKDANGFPAGSGSVRMRYIPTGEVILIKQLSVGSVTFTIQTIASGSYNYAFDYLGFDGYAPSSTSPVTINIPKAATYLTASLSGHLLTPVFTLPRDSPYTINPTGTLLVKNGTTTVGTLNLTSPLLPFNTASLPQGQYNLSFAYAGDANYLPTTTAPIAATVYHPPVLTIPTLHYPYGTTITLTATMPNYVVGEIAFLKDGKEIGRRNVSNGVATLQMPAEATWFPLGHFSATAFFIPANDPTHPTAASADRILFINKPKPSVQLTRSAENPTDGSLIFWATPTFPTVNLLNANRQSKVFLYRDNVLLQTVNFPDNATTVSFVVKPPTGGTYFARFEGNAYLDSSDSPSITFASSAGREPVLSLSTDLLAYRVGANAQLTITFDRPFNGSVHISGPANLDLTRAVNAASITIPVPITIPGNLSLIVRATPSANPWNQSKTYATGITATQPTVIDLLALYSVQAGNVPELVSRIETAVADTNTAFANSGIPVTLRLVAIAPTNYTESGSLSTDLKRLYTLNDGHIDNVTALRNKFGADLSALFVSKSSPSTTPGLNTVGIATELYYPNSPNRAEDSYMVVAQSFYDEYVLAHEVAHTLGTAHALGDETDDGATPYSHGYRFYGDDGVQYHDIMAYDPGTQIPYFSNPDITYKGVPIGDHATANASRLISENAPVVSNHRPAAKPFGAVEALSLTSVAGWSIDPKAIAGENRVRIDIDGVTVGTLRAIVNRPDIASAFGKPRQGYSYTLPALSEGAHTVSVYALDVETGEAILLGSRTVVKRPLLFDESFYLARYPDIAAAVKAGATTAWTHFSTAGQYELRTPSAYFDAAFYLAKNPDLAAAYNNKQLPSPFAHYLASGQFENRQASPYFDPRFYRLANPDINTAINSGIIKSAVAHFLSNGLAEGRNPIPFFDTANYKLTLAGAGTTAPLPYAHFLSTGNPAALAPSTWFNPATYLQLNPDLAAPLATLKLSAFDHFLRFGFKEGRLFSSSYNEKTYLAKNPDVANAVKSNLFSSGFEHFLLFGQKENRSAV